MRIVKFIFVQALLIINLNAQELNSINKLFESHEAIDMPGLVVSVIRDGEVIHNKGYGIANLEYNVPITTKTVFHIASVSKQFTAFSILLLESQGKLSLDDPINKYLKDFPEYGDKIKIKHLIHHTSGLREIETLQQIAGITSADYIGADHIFNLIKKQTRLNFIPGDELEYSNTGYFLLSKIVEEIAGISFSQWTQENIFTPLLMKHTMFYDDCTTIIKNRAYPYWVNDQKLVKGILNYSYVGPTSIMTTSEDMNKWLMNFSKIKIGDDNIISRMLSETGTLNSGEYLDYGYGLGITDYKGEKVVLHSGHDAAYRAATLYFPKFKTGISVLSNFYAINPMDSGFNIADIILKNELQVNTSNALESKKYDPQKRKELFRLQKEDLKEFLGNYVCDELNVQYNLYNRKDRIIAKFWRNEEVILTAQEQDCFKGDPYWFKEIKFLRNNDNNITGFNLSSGRVRDLVFRKIEQ